VTQAQPPQKPQSPKASPTQEAPKPLDEWKPYDLDYYAQELVIKNRNTKEVLNESHKMRMTVAYGLERFWGEQFRLEQQNKDKAKYWQAVWQKVAEILNGAGIELPNKNIRSNHQNAKQKEVEESENIRKMAEEIWKMNTDDRTIALMVLTQFCDSLVWWTQRYKKRDKNGNNQGGQ
jgi:CRISPR/Cas system CSM-associated protein Csm2 small subunit